MLDKCQRMFYSLNYGFAHLVKFNKVKVNIMQNKQPSKLEILGACVLGLALGAGLSLVYIYRTGGF